MYPALRRQGKALPLALCAVCLALVVPAGCQPGPGLGRATEMPARTVFPDARPVLPAGETESVPGDADDPAVWVHPSDPARSLVIGTDKHAGLVTWDLDGHEVQRIASGEPNNVDVRYGFALGDRLVDIVAATNRWDNRMDVYRVDPGTRRLIEVSGRFAGSELEEVYGFCLYRSPGSGRFYAFVNDTHGDVEQWLLYPEDGRLSGRRVRAFAAGARTEGCVADDEQRQLYLGVEDRGIWRYGAEPDAGAEGTQVDVTGAHLVADVEGLTMYYGANGTGYLIASSQSSNDFAVYDRRPPNPYLGRFTIVAGNGIDAVSHTDGIDVSNLALGPRYAQGLFVAHDHADEIPRNNYKLVPWESVALAMAPALLVDPASWDPRSTRLATP